LKQKLVRDKIPQIINDSGKTCDYHVADDDEYKSRLYEKLREELDEFIEKPCLEEAGDMYEVFVMILRTHQIDFADVVFEAHDKKKERGGFYDRIVLERVSP
tara:strand:- start:565 stop:870 length:306 start_codon:yes stop_codon:yes gene_type:complete